MTKAKNKFPFSIDRRLCKKCGICIMICPMDVFVAGKDTQPVVEHPESCIQCKRCFFSCPDFAIQQGVST